MAVLEPRTEVELEGRVLPLHGSYDERFAPVVEAFVENYRVEEEVGSGESSCWESAMGEEPIGGGERRSAERVVDERVREAPRPPRRAERRWRP